MISAWLGPFNLQEWQNASMQSKIYVFFYWLGSETQLQLA